MDSTKNSDKSSKYNSATSDSGFSSTNSSSTPSIQNSGHASSRPVVNVIPENDNPYYETPETLPASLRTFSLNKAVNSLWTLNEDLVLPDDVFQKFERKLVRLLLPFMDGASEEDTLTESEDESDTKSVASSIDTSLSEPSHKKPRRDSGALDDDEDEFNEEEFFRPDPALCLLVGEDLAKEVTGYVSLEARSKKR